MAGEFGPVEGVKVISVPALEMAKAQGSERSANTIMLGVLKQLGVSKITEESFTGAVKANFAAKPNVAKLNVDILESASRYAREKIVD
jgi:Pyruvate/2-oxoacid:ferredoxin oxidoreductase gamma subunit